MYAYIHKFSQYQYILLVKKELVFLGIFFIILGIHGNKTLIFKNTITNFLIVSTNLPIINEKEQNKHKNSKQTKQRHHNFV